MINAIILYKIEHFLYRRHIPILPKIIKLIIFIIYNSNIPYECNIGENTKFGYSGISVVLHKECTIGSNCIIAQCVTVGGKGAGSKGVPKVGDNVYIGAGAKILGNIEIGNNVIIGANSVVTKDVPDYAVVAGAPAKIIRYIREDKNE